MPKKIAIYMFSLGGSGGVKVLVKTANNLRELGYDVVFYVAEPPRERLEFENACEIVYATGPSRGFFRRILWLQRIESDADIAVATYFPTAYSVWLSRSRFRARIYYIQAYEPKFFTRPLRLLVRRCHHYLLARASYLLPLTQVANCKGSMEGIPPNKRSAVRIIEPGIDPEIYSPIPRGSERKLRIGHLGREAAWKGSDDFFIAMKKLRDAGESFDICVAYDHWPQTYGVEYETLIPSNERELAAYYAACDIVVSTVWDKGFGYPPLESMACGALCFATPMDFGEPYFDHVPINPHDPDSIVDAYYWVKDNAGRIPSLLEAAQGTASKFYWPELTKRWVEILESAGRTPGE